MAVVTLKITPWRLAVCKITTDAIPAWSSRSEFLSFSRTPTEYSVVCEERCVPDGIRSEQGWRCLKVEGVLDFSLIGIVAGITQSLASKAISVFVISTFDTDYVLTKQEAFAAAREALEAGGYELVD